MNSTWVFFPLSPLSGIIFPQNNTNTSITVVDKSRERKHWKCIEYPQASQEGKYFNQTIPPPMYLHIK